MAVTIEEIRAGDWTPPEQRMPTYTDKNGYVWDQEWDETGLGYEYIMNNSIPCPQRGIAGDIKQGAIIYSIGKANDPEAFTNEIFIRSYTYEHPSQYSRKKHRHHLRPHVAGKPDRVVVEKIKNNRDGELGPIATTWRIAT